MDELVKAGLAWAGNHGEATYWIVAVVVVAAIIAVWKGPDWWASLHRKVKTAEIEAEITTRRKLDPPTSVPEPTVVTVQPEVALNNLPVTSRDFVGRGEDLAWLDAAWEENADLAVLVAEGGTGKSVVTAEWLDRLKARGWAGAERVFGWSFFSQGSSERQTATEDFAAAALAFFGDDGPPPRNPWEWGERIAAAVARHRGLLALDGLEPLQYPPGPLQGEIKDPMVQRLLNNLVRNGHGGLAVVTTRVPVAGIAGAGVRERTVPGLSAEAGGELLGKLGVKGSAAEREKLAGEYHGHALSLTLLGTYLRQAHHGAIAKAAEVKLLEADAGQDRARKVMDRYVAWMAERPREMAALSLAGLFDRPARGELVAVLRAEPAIPGLTEAVAGLPQAEWNRVVSELREAHLLLPEDPADPDGIDAHPLVREYFADRLKRTAPAGWQAAHSRLYEHLRDTTKHFPDTLAEMQPLYEAVAHGCAAGRHQEALDDVFWKRIMRGKEHFNARHLGAFASDLTAMAGFFRDGWEEMPDGLTAANRAWLQGEVGFTLNALGRLPDAILLQRAALAGSENVEDWENAAVAAINLSEALLLNGKVGDAVEVAGKAVGHAGKGKDGWVQMAATAKAADTLLEAGRREEAMKLFAKAETLLARIPRQPSTLYSLAGLQYCGLLVDRHQLADARRRAERARAVASNPPNTAFAELSLGRIALAEVRAGKVDGSEARTLLVGVVDRFRAIGQQQFIARSLLARAELWLWLKDWPKAEADLVEARDIVTAGHMRLYLADVELETARLRLARGRRDEARAAFEAGRKLVAEMGYHRRDAAVAELEAALAGAPVA